MSDITVTRRKMEISCGKNEEKVSVPASQTVQAFAALEPLKQLDQLKVLALEVQLV